MQDSNSAGLDSKHCISRSGFKGGLAIAELKTLHGILKYDILNIYTSFTVFSSTVEKCVIYSSQVGRFGK